MIKKVFQIGLLLTLLIGMFGYVLPASASTPQTYQVLVGSDNPNKDVSIMSYFPEDITIHVGDTVMWQSNSHEIHTVTFLDGESLQPLIIPAPAGFISPLQLNPKAIFPTIPAGGLFDGSTFVNSGFMTTDPEGFQTFSLTFTNEGTFDYICYVHGQMMMGSVTVVGSSTPAPTPSQEKRQAQAELNAAWKNVPGVLAQAYAQIVPPSKNSDGTLTHIITMGYESGNIGIMGFFPKNELVYPGDTVLWKMPASGEAPHTITFFNGTPDQPLVIMDLYQGKPIALVNPAVLFPSTAVLQGIPLNNSDYFNSGILIPGVRNSFSLKVGNVRGPLNYECILHDTSGMSGSLFVAMRGGN